MRIVPVYVARDSATLKPENRAITSSAHRPLTRITRGRGGAYSPSNQDQNSGALERIALNSRVLIIEGISGSGKDTFQAYLKDKLVNRHVYDYSEGDLLQSWKQLQIEGIFALRIQFLKLFVKYVQDTLGRDENAVFLLNRFHLSTYVSTVARQPKFLSEYDKVVETLRTLPVHVFILQLEPAEIEERSLHPERSSTWQKHQEDIIKTEGFSTRYERYVWQQQALFEAATRDRLPYSVVKLEFLPHAWRKTGSYNKRQPLINA